MRILLNTWPLVYTDKTGIGYYVSNLQRELVKVGGIEVYPTVDQTSQAVLTILRRIYWRLRETLGDRYPAFLRDVARALVGYFGHPSGKGRDLATYDLYHETGLDRMPKIEIKSVSNLYDLAFMTCPQFLPKDHPQYWRINVAENVRVARRVIVNTQFVKEEAMDLLKLPEEKIDVIPLAPSGFYHLMADGELEPKKAKKFVRKDYILYVGTVEPRKNLKVLIKAYRDIKRKYDLALVIAGGLGWLYKDIVSYPKELGIEGHVVYTKYVDETSLLYLYRHASVFVYPSLYEGFGLPPLEAMACGIPVLISDIPPLREVIGGAALTFNPMDHEELANLLDRVLSSESLRMDLKNKGLHTSAKYSWEKVVRATIQTYQKALKD